MGLENRVSREEIRSFCWYVDHTFLGKKGPDNVPGKITETGLVIEKDPVTDINMKTGMTS